MIKIKDIIKEHKIIMTESFAAGKLRALTNNWRGNDSDFWSYGAKLGIEWNKITDKEKYLLSYKVDTLKNINK